MVRSGLVTAWRLAGCPTSRSPSSVKATIEGVVRMPSAFSITFGVLPSITATHELVVPRSMPMTLPMSRFLLSAAGRPGPFGTRTGDSARPAEPPHPTPYIYINAAPRRRLGSYRRAGLPRKTYDHGFASRGGNAMAPSREAQAGSARDPPPGMALAHAPFDKVQRRRTMTA